MEASWKASKERCQEASREASKGGGHLCTLSPFQSQKRSSAWVGVLGKPEEEEEEGCTVTWRGVNRWRSQKGAKREAVEGAPPGGAGSTFPSSSGGTKQRGRLCNEAPFQT